ncbi:GNAT family N-acetyltransferase [Lentilactobacillus parabuchneri]|uniref:GNAT family N-acetyltransferase n=1 Tax=Lentilactobacillus parabuchneri TaxID=152331 RepID=UPI0031D6A231
MEDVKFDVITEAIKSLDTSHFIFDWTSPFPNEVVIGAFIKAELVAVIGFIRQYDNLNNYVVNLEVRFEYRGLGLGAALLAIIMQDEFLQPGFDGFVSLTTKTDGTENFYFPRFKIEVQHLLY